MARHAGAVVVEDAAQSMGARLAGRPVGVQGDFGLYSLGPGKPISLGGGGVLSTNGSRYAEIVSKAWKTLSDVGVVGSALAEARLAAFALAFHPRGWWLITRTGLNSAGDREESWGYRLTGLAPSQAAVGLALLPKLGEANQQRRHNAERLMARLAGLEGVCLPRVRSIRRADLPAPAGACAGRGSSQGSFSASVGGRHRRRSDVPTSPQRYFSSNPVGRQSRGRGGGPFSAYPTHPSIPDRCRH